MAKYTETLAEWLAGGGELPAAFSDIESFSDIFVGFYCDSEIGFETENLFNTKLNTYAALYVPEYVKKLAALETLYAAVIAPTKKRVQSGNITRNYAGSMVNNIGAQENKTYDEPLNTATAEYPTTIQSNGEREDSSTYKDRVDTEAYNDRAESEEGLTSGEAQAAAEYVAKRENIIHSLLKRFAPLFYMVY